MKGSELIAEYLVRQKVPYVFGICGHGNVGMLDALHAASMYWEGVRRAYTLALSAQHRARLAADAGRDATLQAQFAAEAEESVAEQAAVERAERGSFEEYLGRMLDGPATATGTP